MGHPVCTRYFVTWYHDYPFIPGLLDPDDCLPGVGPEAGVLAAHHSPPADVGPPAHRVVDHRTETDVLQPATKSKERVFA